MLFRKDLLFLPHEQNKHTAYTEKRRTAGNGV